MTIAKGNKNNGAFAIRDIRGNCPSLRPGGTGERCGLAFVVSLGYFEEMRYALMDSPIGDLTLVSGDRGLEMVTFGRRIPPRATPDVRANGLVLAQLKEYFMGQRQHFDLQINLSGTPFQQMVWRALQDIPYGETRSYGEIARVIGSPSAARAVGMANHQNPISIIVPCHRVIGHDGRLVGYGGGLDVKASLLTLERTSTATHSRGWSTSSQPVQFR